MQHPAIGLILAGVIFAGVVLVAQGLMGKDRDLVGGSFLAKGLFGLRDGTWDQDEVDRRHPPERHPWRLVWIGLGLIVGGSAVGLIWTALAF